MVILIVPAGALIGGILLARFASKKVSHIERLLESFKPKDISDFETEETVLGGWYTALLCATLISLLPLLTYLASTRVVFLGFVRLMREVPAFVFNAVMLFATIGGLVAIIRFRLFFWQRYVVAGLALALPVSTILVPMLERGREEVAIQAKTKIFSAIANDCVPLVMDQKFVEAIKSPQALERVLAIDGQVLLLQAHAKSQGSGYELLPDIGYQKYMSGNLLARNPQDVRVVVIVGEPAQLYDAPFDFSLPPSTISSKPDKLFAPFLAYSWPAKSLLFTGAVRIEGILEREPMRKLIGHELERILRENR